MARSVQSSPDADQAHEGHEEGETMTHQPRKMSEIMERRQLLRLNDHGFLAAPDAVDQAVSVGVELAELIGGAEKLARGNVAVVVPVHPDEPGWEGLGRSAARAATAACLLIAESHKRTRGPAITDRAASEIDLRNRRKSATGKTRPLRSASNGANFAARPAALRARRAGHRCRRRAVAAVRSLWSETARRSVPPRRRCSGRDRPSTPDSVIFPSPLRGATAMVQLE